MALTEWNVELVLEGPVITQGSEMLAPGLDAAMARTADGTAWCLPGTLVKGLLRQAWEELRTAMPRVFDPPVEKLLGEEAGNDENGGSSVDRVSGTLHFGDLLCTSHKPDDGEKEETLFRVRMNPERGAVDRGAYVVIEAPFAVGEAVRFVGPIRTAQKNPSADLDRWLRKGFGWIPAIGAERTVGFGRILSVRVDRVDDPGVGAELGAGATGIFLLEPLAPFCIAKKKVASNLFEAEEVIPGGVIKGCLASTWAQNLGKRPQVGEDFDPTRPELSQCFWAVRFTHAFPIGSDNKRPVVPPASLVRTEPGTYRDVALVDGPALVDGVAPAFAIDWKGKDFGTVFGWFGWPELKKSLRIRTAMDATRRAGKDAALFGVETVVPGGIRWAFSVDLSRVPDELRGKVGQQLHTLLAEGLLGLGKTKAAVRIHPGHEVTARVAPDTAPVDGQWVVTLQTPTLLCDPTGLDETSGQTELHQAYLEAWEQLSRPTPTDEPTLTMKSHLARQSLAGGFYLHNKFGGGGNRYRPYLLTDAGSVFVLAPREGHQVEAEKCIETWTNGGLSVPAWVFGTDSSIDQSERWRHCPYLPENGYGEVTVNLPMHWGKDLPEGGDG